MNNEEKQLLELLRFARDSYNAEEYESAYKFAKKAQLFDPTNAYARKIITKSAKKIRKSRKKELKKREKLLQPLWDLKEYENLLNAYTALDKFYPHHFPTKLRIAYIKSKLNSNRKVSSSNYKKQIKKQIKLLHKQGKFLEATHAIEEAKPYFEGESWIEHLEHKVKHDFVVDQLKYRQSLLENQEYEALYKFLLKLYKIFPEPRIKNYITQTEELILEKRKYEKSVFIEDSLDLINSLYADGKYEDSMKVCEELLGLTNNTNLKAKTFFYRSYKQNEKEMNVMIKGMMLTKNEALKNIDPKNESFIKI